MLDVSAVISWFEANRRALPWRSSTPYGVLLSEVMLQQTPVARVLPVWNAWMERWPDVHTLARASRADLLRMWGGLGYPRRAIRLHDAARAIVDDHGGEVPQDEQVLRTLPGIGEYTAAAIAAFAFQRPSVVLDINVRRLLARSIHGVNAPSPSISRMERELARQLLPEQDAHLWAAASMELGAVICTARTPTCDACPLRAQCAWRAAGYPVTVAARTQAWHGTDRQCRGALMRVLRGSDAPVEQAMLDAAWADQVQRERCLTQLVREGLIEPLPHQHFTLPR